MLSMTNCAPKQDPCFSTAGPSATRLEVTGVLPDEPAALVSDRTLAARVPAQAHTLLVLGISAQ